MFKHLAAYSKIIVTGPHRSGTTIAAKMIAADTGHRLLLEEDCNFCDAAIDAYGGPCVIQAPFIASTCHQYNAFIVFMMRDVTDIEASQERMINEDGSRVFWPKFEMSIRDKYHTDYEKPVAEITYCNWNEQKLRIPNYLEVNYMDLSTHHLWLDKRTDFHVRQTYAVG